MWSLASDPLTCLVDSPDARWRPHRRGPYSLIGLLTYAFCLCAGLIASRERTCTCHSRPTVPVPPIAANSGGIPLHCAGDRGAAVSAVPGVDREHGVANDF